MAESEEELKSLWMRVKEESKRASFRLNIKKKIASWRNAKKKKKKHLNIPDVKINGDYSLQEN